MECQPGCGPFPAGLRVDQTEPALGAPTDDAGCIPDRAKAVGGDPVSVPDQLEPVPSGGKLEAMLLAVFLRMRFSPFWRRLAASR